MEANKIIIKPLLSEKSYSDIKNKKYWFVVDKNATKSLFARFKKKKTLNLENFLGETGL